jgi:hypothetical protein
MSSKASVESARPSRAPQALRLNDAKKLETQILRFGQEKSPVLVVDNILANAEEVRAYALGLHFGAPTWDYPGYQANCALRGVRELCAWAARVLWTEGFALDDPQTRLRGIDTESFFAAFAPSKTRRYSNVRTDWHSSLELLVHLTPGEEQSSGTGFWRHAATGIESACNGPAPHDLMLRLDKTFKTDLVGGIARARKVFPQMTYGQWVGMLQSLMTAPPFPAGDYGQWKSIGSVDAVFNRLVVYPTWQFHSVIMKKEALATSLETARLTLQSFIRFPLLKTIEKLPAAPMEGIE